MSPFLFLLAQTASNRRCNGKNEKGSQKGAALMNGIFRRDRLWLWGTLALLLFVVTYFYALAHAGAEPADKDKKSDAVTLEDTADKTVKRVTLSAKAAERLGIETGEVGEATVARRQMVGGTVILPDSGATEQKVATGSFSGFALGAMSSSAQPAVPTAPPPAAPPKPVEGDVWIRVTLSPAEYERLAKDQQAQIDLLQTREKAGHKLVAQPMTTPPIEDAKRSMLTLFYVLPGKEHGLSLNERVRVGLPLVGATGPETVVPYGAVYYDAEGTAWVYVTSKPLTFERKRIAIDRVVGDLAVLRDGPQVGTKVVTIGAAMLSGAEGFGK